MDTSRELFVADAEGWRLGLYEDIRATFRAPVVNWIFRTLVANEPDATRYLWGQLKPLFETRAAAECVAGYRDAVLAAVEADARDHDLPTLEAGSLGLDDGAFDALQGQLATFDAVVPRLAVLFVTVDAALSGTLPEPREPSYAATAPFPGSMAREGLRPPDLVEIDDIPTAGAETVAAVRAFHGFDEGLSSVYRCLLQWPGAFEAIWAALGDPLGGDGFAAGTAAGERRVETYLADRAYDPRIGPADLGAAGVDAETVDALGSLFAEFRHGAVRTVLPAVVVVAAAAGVGGPRAVE